LSKYLKKRGFELSVISEGIQKGNTYKPEFTNIFTKLKFSLLIQKIINVKPKAVILFVNLNNLYLFPIIFCIKLLKIKVVYWGHGIDLQDKQSLLKLLLYRLEHYLSDGIILYAEHLKNNIIHSLHYKCFIANNTLNFTEISIEPFEKDLVLSKYGITTKKIIILTGRIQKRKRIEDLIQAFKKLNDCTIGLICVGPCDDELYGMINNELENVFFLGPIYGSEAIRILMSSDVYCIPGSIGLSIVDAQFCGLPIVTENVDHGPEIMYFKEGVNGYMVPKGDINALANRLSQLLYNDDLRKRFSVAAKEGIEINGHIDRLCEGFYNCLNFVLLK